MLPENSPRTSIRALHFLVTDLLTEQPVAGAKISLSTRGNTIATTVTLVAGWATLSYDSNASNALEWQVSAPEHLEVTGTLKDLVPPAVISVAISPKNAVVAVRSFPIADVSVPPDVTQILVLGDSVGIIGALAKWEDGEAKASIGARHWSVLLPSSSFRAEKHLRFVLTFKIGALADERLKAIRDQTSSACNEITEKTALQIGDGSQLLSKVIDANFDLLLATNEDRDINKQTPLDLARTLLAQRKLELGERATITGDPLQPGTFYIREDAANKYRWNFRLDLGQTQAHLYIRANSIAEPNIALTEFDRQFVVDCNAKPANRSEGNIVEKLDHVVVSSEIGLKTPRITPEKWFLSMTNGGLVWKRENALFEGGLFVALGLSFYPEGLQRGGIFSGFAADSESGAASGFGVQLSVGAALPFRANSTGARGVATVGPVYNFGALFLAGGPALEYDFAGGKPALGLTVGLGVNLY